MLIHRILPIVVSLALTLEVTKTVVSRDTSLGWCVHESVDQYVRPIMSRIYNTGFYLWYKVTDYFAESFELVVDQHEPRGIRETPNTDPRRLKVCTWNIHNGKTELGADSVPRLIDYFDQKDFDIILMQEAPTDRKSSLHNLTATEYLKSRLGYHGCSYANQIVLSKYPVRDCDGMSEYIGIFDFGNHRMEVVIDVDGTDVKIFNYHLSNDIFGHYQKMFLLKKTLSNATCLKQYPLIVAGDFNSPWWWEGVQYTKNELGYEPDFESVELPTYPAYYPMLGLDKLYTNERLYDRKIRFIEGHVEDTVLSDHCPLICTLELSLS